ncbi:hypothetical protein Droror1_Dr00003402 [Drosera rotundifolia]
MPLTGRLEINVDKANKTQAVVCLGRIIKDDRGEIQLVAYRKLHLFVEPIGGEALAVRFGLELAKTSGMERVTMESDCQTMVSMIERRSAGLSLQGGVVRDCLLLFDEFLGKQIAREFGVMLIEQLTC